MKPIQIIETFDRKNNRFILSICHIDYDVSDTVAQIMSNKYGDIITEKLDNLWGTLIIMQSNEFKYVISYDEDYRDNELHISYNENYIDNKNTIFHNELKNKLVAITDELNLALNQ
ncbi:MAG: hypothetical protein IJ566_02530 [Cardiobacteriaceae bacterium]|nr:hypothetical protein [Cardiobacteriaceae bacterium]